jgi:predicted nucleotidyltransferase
MRNKKIILKNLSKLKKELKNEGFIIDGIIGSFVKSDNFNDLDLVYHLEDKFLKKYQGFSAVNKIEEIRQNLQSVLKIKVDLIDKEYSNSVMKCVIKRDLVNA